MPPIDDAQPPVPDQLKGLAARKSYSMAHYLHDPLDVEFAVGRSPLRPTLARRLRGLVILETTFDEPRVVNPSWSHEDAIPGLIVAQRYSGGDAFGVARQVRELDLAV